MLLNLNTIERVKRFSEIVLKYECDIDVIRGRYVIDAKSIIGLFTLDISKPVEIHIHSTDKEVLEQFNKDMEEFLCEDGGLEDESILSR